MEEPEVTRIFVLGVGAWVIGMLGLQVAFCSPRPYKLTNFITNIILMMFGFATMVNWI